MLVVTCYSKVANISPKKNQCHTLAAIEAYVVRSSALLSSCVPIGAKLAAAAPTYIYTNPAGQPAHRSAAAPVRG